MTDILSSPAEVSFTNNGELANNAQATANAAQANAMFYVGDTQPSNPQVGMVWVNINQANDNWLMWGQTNQPTSTTIKANQWSPPTGLSVYGSPQLRPAGTVMTISCWLDLTGENVADLKVNGHALKDSNGSDWYVDDNVVTKQYVKAGTAGWAVTTFKMPRTTEEGNIQFYIAVDAPQSKDIPLQYSSWKLDWDSRRTQWCDGPNRNKGNVDNAQKWDGSKWVPTQFTSDVIADYIYGKSIIGSTFANATGSFKVDANGNINGANITGSNITGSTLRVDGGAGNTGNSENPFAWSSISTSVSNGIINSQTYGTTYNGNSVGNLSSTLSSAGIRFHSPIQTNGIGTDSSYFNAHALSVAGNLFDAFSLYIGNIKINNQHSYYSLDGGGIYFRPSGDSGGVALNATAFNKISQLSTKTNIHPMDTHLALNTLNGLELTKYKRINNLNMGQVHDEYGGIIDDINDTPQYRFPKELLSYAGDAEDDSNLLAFAVASIQELTKLNEKLQLRVALLEAQNGTNSNHAN